MPALLGIDIGTTSTIGILIDTEGRTLATASRPADLLSPEANWAEEDPAQWWSNTRAVIAELLGETGLAGADIAAIGTTGMVPALVLLDAEGRVLRRSMQQNDARALAEIDEMGRRVDPADFLAATGGRVNQQIVAPKLRWLQRHEPDVFARIATISWEARIGGSRAGAIPASAKRAGVNSRRRISMSPDSSAQL